MSIKAEMIDHGRLTEREAEVAILVSEGYSDKAIAGLLAISIKTVSCHTQMIYEKLDLRSHQLNARCSAIVTLIARGMIRLSINCLFAVLLFNVVQLDDGALRVSSSRLRAPVSRVRRGFDAYV